MSPGEEQNQKKGWLIIPTPMAPAEIITAVTSSLTSLGILPYVFAGAVIALVGRLIMSARKAAR